MRKFILVVVCICGGVILIAPYFFGKAANETFLHWHPISWPYLWSIGFIVCLCLIGGGLFILAFWTIAQDIADWAEKKFK